VSGRFEGPCVTLDSIAGHPVWGDYQTRVLVPRSFDAAISDSGPHNAGRGWGVFAEITKADGNPNTLEWSGYVGLGGSSLIPGRPDDRFGVAHFRYSASDILETELAPVFNLTDQSGVRALL
jgi:Carbohydrate-selective porin, OprB family